MLCFVLHWGHFLYEAGVGVPPAPGCIFSCRSETSIPLCSHFSLTLPCRLASLHMHISSCCLQTMVFFGVCCVTVRARTWGATLPLVQLSHQWEPEAPTWQPYSPHTSCQFPTLTFTPPPPLWAHCHAHPPLTTTATLPVTYPPVSPQPAGTVATIVSAG